MLWKKEMASLKWFEAVYFPLQWKLSEMKSFSAAKNYLKEYRWYRIPLHSLSVWLKKILAIIIWDFFNGSWIANLFLKQLIQREPKIYWTKSNSIWFNKKCSYYCPKPASGMILNYRNLTNVLNIDYKQGNQGWNQQRRRYISYDSYDCYNCMWCIMVNTKAVTTYYQ